MISNDKADNIREQTNTDIKIIEIKIPAWADEIEEIKRILMTLENKIPKDGLNEMANTPIPEYENSAYWEFVLNTDLKSGKELIIKKITELNDLRNKCQIDLDTFITTNYCSITANKLPPLCNRIKSIDASIIGLIKLIS
jgi:hypothetical protein